MGPLGLADFLPRRADIVASGRLDAEVGMAFSLVLSLGMNLTLTLSVRVQTVPVKPSF